MKHFLGLVAALAAASLVGAQSANTVPVLIELFTSEGCSSCPPADQLLSALDRQQPIKGVQLIVLSEHVDYWNSSGWSDPYSSHEFTERQMHYGMTLGVPESYTPQAVIDGKLEAVGSNQAKLEAAVEQAKRAKKIPLHLAASQSDKGIHVELRADESAPRNADLYFAVAEDAVQSKVSAGENGGRMLSHTAVVRSFTKASKISGGGSLALDLKTSAHWGSHLRVIAFLAEHGSGKILGATMTELQSTLATDQSSRD